MLLVWRQNYLQAKAMLNAALQNPNLSETERAAVKEHAQRHGIGAALGLLGGLVIALQKRNRSSKADPWPTRLCLMLTSPPNKTVNFAS